jgi:ABC-type sugar transport system substrate-binding protein
MKAKVSMKLALVALFVVALLIAGSFAAADAAELKKIEAVYYADGKDTWAI